MNELKLGVECSMSRCECSKYIPSTINIDSCAYNDRK